MVEREDTAGRLLYEVPKGHLRGPHSTLGVCALTHPSVRPCFLGPKTHCRSRALRHDLSASFTEHDSLLRVAVVHPDHCLSPPCPSGKFIEVSLSG